MQLTVVFVSYNTRDLLRNALRSIFHAQLPPSCSLSVIVVDNNSGDESAAMVAAEFPAVTLFASPTNLGFTGGNNLALYALGLQVTPPATSLTVTPHHAAPDYVLLLNPDTFH